MNVNSQRAAVISVALLCGWLASTVPAQESVDHFQQGQVHYENGQYELAVEHLQQAFRQDPGNLQLNMMLGLAALRAEAYETAAAAFDRVLAMRPDWDRARLELARSYYHLQLYIVAEDLFREVADDPETPESVRQNIEPYLRRISEATREHHFGGAVSVSLVRDSNARVSPDGTVDIPGLPPLTVPVERDWFIAQTLILDHRWQPKHQRLAWQTQLLGYNAFYDTEDDLDVNYLRIDTGPMRRFGRFSAGAAANAAFMEKDYDRYLGTIGARAWGAADVGRNTAIRLEWRGEERRYWQDQDADGFSNTLALKPSYVCGPHALVADLGVEAHNADAGSETYDKWFAAVAYQLALPWKMSLLTSYRYENWLFEEADVLADQRRRDQTHKASVALRKLLTRQVAVDLKHTYETSHSNIDLYDFDRNVTSLTLTVAF